MLQLSTAKRIILGFAIAPVALTIVVLYALHDLATLKDQSVNIVEQDWPKMSPVMAISNLIRDNGKNTRDLLINKDNEAVYPVIESTKQQVTQAFATLEPLFDTAEGKALFAQLKANRMTYVAGFTNVVALIKQNDRDGAQRQLQNQVIPAEADVYKSLNSMMAMQGQLFEQRKEDAKALYENAWQNMIGLLVACLILVIVAAIMVTRSVMKPLGGEPVDAARVLRQIAQGDLTVKVMTQPGDTDSLMFNMHAMQQSLAAMVRQIADAVDHVASSSEELSTVSSETSGHLQRQGAEIEQAATAVTEMTAAVDEVARNAVSTSQASQYSTQTAQRGKEQVQETVASIGELTQGVSDTSGRMEQLAGRVHDISKVLDVIRSIAEQTNLLALNAAIEAARAGDAGRGFAVVADEVRALAHRTQVSTQEIEQMIGNIRQDTGHAVDAMQSSSTLVRATLEVAQRAGDALDEITQSISHINERNLLIASATEEQALVAREVDRNLIGIRSISEQVLSGASHTDTAGQELARMAASLHATVSRFQI